MLIYKFKFIFALQTHYVQNWTPNLLLQTYASSCISYLLLKVRMSFLSLRLETSLIFSLSYPLATIFLILLDDTFTMCLLPFLLFILHLHISSFLNFCSIFLIQPTFNSIRHINIRVIFGKLQIWISYSFLLINHT